MQENAFENFICKMAIILSSLKVLKTWVIVKSGLYQKELHQARWIINAFNAFLVVNFGERVCKNVTFSGKKSYFRDRKKFRVVVCTRVRESTLSVYNFLLV